MSGCIEKRPHSCGSGDGLQVFAREDGTVDGYCFACSTYVRHPYGDRVAVEDIEKPKLKKSKEEIEAEMAEVGECSAMDLKVRRIRKGPLDKYGIKVGVSRVDGTTPNVVAFPYREKGELVAYKMRLLEEKRSWWIGDASNVDFFGWQEAIESGAKRLIITEGEFDVPAAFTIMDRETKEDFKGLMPAFISIPHGAGTAASFIQKKLSELHKYFREESIGIMFDQDEAGQKATRDVCKVLPLANVITLPKKDANDCLINGTVKAAYKQMQWNPTKPKNSSIVWGKDVHEQARKPAEWGYSWPWEHLNQVTRGIRLGETIYIGAG